ncbi:MFS transporter [Duganella sp. FT80W]|uniref:MFS transporter n=1 Tax=Duganella guangzhouensis TaxID=2666084 RepID=A0A6I2KTD1_9BURK|nr:MFS transporter [Duganella guangzhouensis]MRW88540.1 MFS transporter [Duganella guangzhouensis]
MRTIPPRSPRLIQAIILLITSGLTVLVSAILGPNIPQLQEHFSKQIANADQWVPLAVSIPIGVFGLCAIFIGNLADKVGRKNLLVYSTLAYTVLGTMPFYIDNFWAIFASRVALGVFEAALMTASTTMIGDYYQGLKRERMMSLQTTTSSATATVFVAVGAAVGTLGWNAPFAIYALALLLLPLMAIYLWEPVPDNATDKAAVESAEGEQVIFRPRLVALTCAIGFFVGIAFMVVPINLGILYATQGWAPNIGTGYTLNSAGVMLGTFIFGWVLAGRTSVPLQLCLSLAIGAVGYILMGTAHNADALTTGAIVNGLGCGLLLPTVVTWNMRILPFAKRGLGTGAFQSALMLGMAVSSLILVSMGNVVGSRAVAVAEVGTVMAASAVVALLCWLAYAVRQRHPRATNFADATRH